MSRKLQSPSFYYIIAYYFAFDNNDLHRALHLTGYSDSSASKSESIALSATSAVVLRWR